MGTRRTQGPANRQRTRVQPHRAQPVSDSVFELEGMRVIERPDGYYVQPVQGGREAGPYASLVEAIDDLRIPESDGLEPCESLAEAEAELGMADWIDPETSSLAEDSVPRLEEH